MHSKSFYEPILLDDVDGEPFYCSILEKGTIPQSITIHSKINYTTDIQILSNLCPWMSTLPQ